MLHPDALRERAAATPDKAAVRVANTDRVTTYAELDARADRVAKLLQSRGVADGRTAARLPDHEPDVTDLRWAARRAGVYYVPLRRGRLSDAPRSEESRARES